MILNALRAVKIKMCANPLPRLQRCNVKPSAIALG
jgi:hypothetical protein